MTTRYPGASAKTVIDTVALPIEQQVNGVEDMLYMQSYSGSDGTYTLTVTFKIGTDLNFAQVLVQNRVSSALSSLPQSVQNQGVTVQKKSTAILLFVTLTSPTMRLTTVSFSATTPRSTSGTNCRGCPGVGNVTVFGAGQYSMRVWLDPNKLQVRGLMPQDVIQAIQQQSQQVTAGQVGDAADPFGTGVSIYAERQRPARRPRRIRRCHRQDRQQWRRHPGARRRPVELGAQTYSQIFSLNKQAGHRHRHLPVARRQRARGREGGREEDGRAGGAIPAGREIRHAVRHHQIRLGLDPRGLQDADRGGLLVLVVIVVFLQDWRAMLVPATTVPVTIIGAFAAMAALGFTINLSTLFAIVLAIGIVVDDAIVVVEGAAHNIEKGMSGHDAAIQAMDELFAPIIGITLVLISVFLPAAFLPGLTGRMYAQFALVIAATALLSAVNAATLKPTQCALWLRPPVPLAQRNWFYRGFNSVYARIEKGYAGLIGRMAAHSNLSVVVALILIGIGGYGLSRVPTGFIPIEDQGYLLVGGAVARRRVARPHPARARPGQRTGGQDARSQSGHQHCRHLGARQQFEPGQWRCCLFDFEGLERARRRRGSAFTGGGIEPGDGGHTGSARSSCCRRRRSRASEMPRASPCRSNCATAIPISANCRPLPVPSSPMRRRKARCSASVRRSVRWCRSLTSRSTGSRRRPCTSRPIRCSLHWPSYLGSSYVNQFTKFGRTFQVYAQAESQFRLTTRDIEKLMVRNQNGDMIPLGTLATITPSVGPSLISLYNLYPSSTVIGLPAQGYSSGQSMALMDEIAAKTLPPGTGYEWTAMSYQEKASATRSTTCSVWRMLLVYLVLAGQYESWYAPISVILAVPLSLLGPMAVLTGLRIENNLYTQIGLILLIALSAKNAILIVEVALELHVRDRKPLLESAVEAARARFRPILMTSFAFILGVAPLVVASGAGASARKSIGITVFSRHDRLDLPRGAVRADVLCRGAAVRELARGAKDQESRPADEPAGAERYILTGWDGKRGPREVRVCPLCAYSFTIRLPRFSPANSPIRAFGVFSKPLIMSSWTFSLPGGDPRLQVAQCLVALIHEVHHDEALHDKPLHHDQAGYAARPGRRRHAVILRDRPAAGDAAAIVHLRQAGFQNIAADIVEIDIDAFRRRGLQGLEHRAVLVVDRGIEAEFAGQPLRICPCRRRCRRHDSP